MDARSGSGDTAVNTTFGRRSSTGCERGQSASKEILPFTYTVAVIPAGKGIFSFVKLQRIGFQARTNTVVYAVGSLAGGTFKLLTQRIPLA